MTGAMLARLAFALVSALGGAVWLRRALASLPAQTPESPPDAVPAPGLPASVVVRRGPPEFQANETANPPARLLRGAALAW